MSIKKERSIVVICLAFLVTSLWSCRSSDKEPDVSNIPVPIQMDRFDQDFLYLDLKKLDAELKQLENKYPDFFPVFVEQIMNFGTLAKDTFPKEQILSFIESEQIRSLQDTVNQHFPEKKLAKIREGLKTGFQYTKYYFPSFKVPRVVTFVSALANYGAVTVDSVLGIGLDMFLGPHFPIYQELSQPYPSYLLKTFSPEYIVPSSLQAVVQQRYPPPTSGTLLDQMIAFGKQYYFLDRVLPQTPDSLKIGYSREQLDWCKKNEQLIWQYFVKNDLLYKKDAMTIRYYIGAGPSSKGLPTEAPGNIGSWLGWQIVKKYMKDHSTGVEELMEMQDSQKLLRESKYRPH